MATARVETIVEARQLLQLTPVTKVDKALVVRLDQLGIHLSKKKSGYRRLRTLEDIITELVVYIYLNT